MMGYDGNTMRWMASVKKAAEQSCVRCVYLIDGSPYMGDGKEGGMALLVEMDDHAGLSDYFRFREMMEAAMGSSIGLYTTGIGEGIRLKRHREGFRCLYKKEGG
ncbi:hypothetical protein L0N08_18820 [Enterocloster aldenensis]|uniref:Uncharacterized protein n=1 Tax=Enterocloster aldenensis TaxID=358742 RepID=A0AAW5BXD0_9FIRM|nr:hypothetical protein [Enterocloster aldenensis]